jgi:hypothetical protein
VPEDSTTPGPGPAPCGDRGRPRALRGLLALLGLNLLLSFENWWPTPAIKPDWRLAPELVALWVLLLFAVRLWGEVSRRLVVGLSLVYLLLVLGRYVDVTAPALFGRTINLYWDAPQLPRFLAVVGQHLAVWQSLVLAFVAALAVWSLYRLIGLAVGVAARHAAPLAIHSRTALAATAAAVGLVSLNAAGVQATWPLVSKPVTPTFVRQADILITAYSPTRLAAALPPSPAFDSDLAALRGSDVKLIFLESYGATVFDDPESLARLAPSRESLAKAVSETGRQVVSAFVRSPTFGGASDMAHLGLLSGIDLSDPLRHDLLLTTQRPTLIDLFRAQGYETFGFYPALSWDWPEGVFYRFDRLVDGPDLGYRGPHIGPWWIPDQYAVARFDEIHPIDVRTPPRLLFFATINSHFPFAPLPPYQPDWSKILSAHPFDDADVARALAEETDWTNLRPAYLRAIEYTYAWLAGYLRRPAPRDYLLVLIGDHQPVAGVSGPGASWDVPVHIVTSDENLLRRFEALGFRRGLEPPRPIIGAMHDLTRMLLEAFDGRRARVESMGSPSA